MLTSLPHEFSEIQEDVQIYLWYVEIPESLKNGTILVAEDSRSANVPQKFLREVESLFKIFENGGPLLEYVQEISTSPKYH